MGRIVRLSLKVDEVRSTGDFYKKVFGFQDAETRKTRDHVSRHMTDGEIDFTLMKYDAGTQSAESKAAGDGPCIHHFAIEVDDIAAATAEIQARGCEIVSDPGVIPVKFRAPGGTVAELVPIGRYKQRLARTRATASCTCRSRSTSREDRRLLPGGLRLQRLGDQQDARPHLAPHDRRRIDFTLMKYDAGTSRRNRRRRATARASTISPSRSPTSTRRRSRSRRTAAEMVSDPGVIPVKFRAPGGTLAELVPLGRYKR